MYLTTPLLNLKFILSYNALLVELWRLLSTINIQLSPGGVLRAYCVTDTQISPCFKLMILWPFNMICVTHHFPSITHDWTAFRYLIETGVYGNRISMPCTSIRRGAHGTV